MTEYKHLGDYIREVIIRNREHRAMQAYTFGDGSEWVRRWKKKERSLEHAKLKVER